MIRRQRIQQFRVQNHAFRQQDRMADAQLLSVFIQHGVGSRLRAAPCRSRNGDMRNMLLLQPVFTRLFQAARTEPGLHRLGRIHGGTAAQGNQAVTALLRIQLHPGFSIRQIRIGMIPRKSRRFPQAFRFLQPGNQLPGSHDQGPLHIQLFHQGFNPGQAAPAAKYFLDHTLLQ